MKLWSNEEFGRTLLAIKGSAKQVWEMVSEAVVQVVMHYHEHSYDSSRCRQLYEVLEESGLGTHLTCYTHVLNKATGIRVGEWKHSAKKLESQPEVWEDVIKRVETLGLESFRPVPKTTAPGEKVKQDKAAKAVTVDDPKVKAALQSAIDSPKFKALPESVQLERLRALGEGKAPAGLDVLKSETVRAKAEEYILHLAELEAKSEEAALRSLEAGIGAVTRNLKNSFNAEINKIKSAA